MIKALARLRAPLSRFKAKEMDKVIGSAKRCLNTTDGEVLLIHLINETDLDEPISCLSPDELLYKSAQQDLLKYIISLTNDA